MCGELEYAAHTYVFTTFRSLIGRTAHVGHTAQTAVNKTAKNVPIQDPCGFE
jgi:hypothetical protein